jgi:hypothetical protein
MATSTEKAAVGTSALEGSYEVGHVEIRKVAAAENDSHIGGDAFLVNKDGEIRKVPAPTDDPNDPLNFRRWEKYTVVFCCCWFSIMGLSIASGLGTILNVMFEMYIPQGYTPDQVVFLITLPTFCIGLGESSSILLSGLVSISKLEIENMTDRIMIRKLHYPTAFSSIWPPAGISYIDVDSPSCYYCRRSTKQLRRPSGCSSYPGIGNWIIRIFTAPHVNRGDIPARTFTHIWIILDGPECLELHCQFVVVIP